MKSLKWNYKTITVMVYYHVHARRRECVMIRFFVINGRGMWALKRVPRPPVPS